MKYLNTLIISSLLTISVNAPVAAAELNEHTAEMNRVLEGQIEARVHATMLTRTTRPSQDALVRSPAAAAKNSSQKTAQKSS